MLPAYLVNYLPAIAYTFACSTFPSLWWALSHATLPLTIQVLARWAARRSTTPLRGPAFQWGGLDLKLFRPFFIILYMVQLLAFPLENTTMGSSRPKVIPLYSLLFSENVYAMDDVKALLLDVIMMAFICFIMWDIRRVRAYNEGFLTMVLINIGMAIVFSPAMALAHLWESRETQWEASRQRKKPIDGEA